MAELKQSTAAPEKLRLLAIDDEPAISALVAQIAGECGYTAVAHHDSTKLGESDFKDLDVMVVDLMMPGLDGIELIRQLGARKAQTRLILLSGLDRRMLESAQKAAHAYGLTVFSAMQKPFRPDDLRKILTTLLEADAPRATEQQAAPIHDLRIEDLAQGLARQELVVHFQPKMSVNDETLVGFEALVRWQHPQLGLLYPSAFIDLAEKSGLALPFTYAVLNTAIASSRQIFEQFSFIGSISINVPSAALTDITFPDQLTQILDRGGFDKSRFILEIGEADIPKDRSLFLDIQSRLRMRGIKLSIDDFGTGHFYLERMGDYTPFDELKIDLTLVQKMESDPASLRIIRNAIQLGHNLGLKVVAEGVENYETLWNLRRMGCDSAQGYFWARPMAGEQLHAWMAQRLDVAYSAHDAETTGSDRLDTPAETEDNDEMLITLNFVREQVPLALSSNTTRKPIHILMVEDSDNAAASQALRMSMLSKGCEVRSAKPGLLALESIKAAPTDVVLIDFDMQNSNGLETIRLLRAHPEIQDTLPIIAFSASATASQTMGILGVGANRYMHKPLQYEKLLAEIGGLVPQVKTAA